MSLIHDRLLSGVPNISEYADSRIENYPLMGSPLQITIILASYALFVMKTGPAFMKNRQPMKLDHVIMVYNWVQIILNTAVFLIALKEWNNFSIGCSPMDQSQSRAAIRIMQLQYSYTLLKFLDLLDTVFFVLRKKDNQVTFLHVYHHLLMAGFGWVVCKFFVGGQIYYVGIANLPVHSVMYFYYFLTAWDSSYKRSIWWKKHLTQFQIVQHFFIFTVFIIPFLNPNCSYPKWLLGVYLINSLMMIYLFSKFYVESYIRKKEKAQ
ncbi:hypothetical protein Zmor_005030 [Zophobas morio]|uniref:Elongation of very long chain fatty acids protein n=1 Tax=Zophobas morio TaxID=2755281 RepID=A0AA38ITN7_9CUCU|nr:hypothetical protein Zmor_005030 [Zophobas morio]